MSVSGITKFRPPVPKGLSSGARQFTVAERWPGSTAPPMPPDRVIESSGWRHMPTGLGQLQHKPNIDIPGMPDCSGTTCDGMCSNAECVGNQRPLTPLETATDLRWLVVPWIAMLWGIGATVYIIANALYK
jgi:hypothetical protein